jgi:hypothetical protein
MTLRIACLPYLHQMQPLAIDTGGKVAGVIVLGDLAGADDKGEGELKLTLPTEKPEG